jgi:hypothetical protein
MPHSILVEVLFSLSLFVLATSIQFDIPAGGEQCFYEPVDQGKPVSVIFQVISGGFNDVNVVIRSQDGTEIYRGEKETDGRLTFTAHSGGTYSFCYGNQMSTVTSKTVEFELTTTLGYEEMERDFAPINIPEDIAKKEHIVPLQNSVHELATAIQTISTEQRYLKMREQAHRNTNESTNSRVLWWGVAEIAMLILAGVWQVFYLRRIFEQKRAI